jgi:hypothetical protein
MVNNVKVKKHFYFGPELLKLFKSVNKLETV